MKLVMVSNILKTLFRLTGCHYFVRKRDIYEFEMCRGTVVLEIL